MHDENFNRRPWNYLVDCLKGLLCRKESICSGNNTQKSSEFLGIPLFHACVLPDCARTRVSRIYYHVKYTKKSFYHRYSRTRWFLSCRTAHLKRVFCIRRRQARKRQIQEYSCGR